MGDLERKKKPHKNILSNYFCLPCPKKMVLEILLIKNCLPFPKFCVFLLPTLCIFSKNSSENGSDLSGFFQTIDFYYKYGLRFFVFVSFCTVFHLHLLTDNAYLRCWEITTATTTTKLQGWK